MSIYTWAIFPSVLAAEFIARLVQPDGMHCCLGAYEHHDHISERRPHGRHWW